MRPPRRKRIDRRGATGGEVEKWDEFDDGHPKQCIELHWICRDSALIDFDLLANDIVIDLLASDMTLPMSSLLAQQN